VEPRKFASRPRRELLAPVPPDATLTAKGCAVLHRRGREQGRGAVATGRSSKDRSHVPGVPCDLASGSSTVVAVSIHSPSFYVPSHSEAARNR